MKELKIEDMSIVQASTWIIYPSASANFYYAPTSRPAGASVLSIILFSTNISPLRGFQTGSTLRFYASASNTGAPGAQYFDVAPGQIFTKTVLEWADVFGFDEDIEDFLNVQNTGTTDGHYKMKWENLGA